VQTTTATVHCAVYRTYGDASMNVFLSQPAWMTTTKRREQNLAVCSSKSEAEVTNNTRLCSTYCTVKANYWQTQSITQPLCNSRTNCQQSVCTAL